MTHTDNDDLLPEYDLERLGFGIRGKYFERRRAGTNVVLIDPDLSEYFSDSDAVNRALREYLGTPY